MGKIELDFRVLGDVGTKLLPALQSGNQRMYIN